MQIWYTGQKLPHHLPASIFLAGPTPRDTTIKSWRPGALDILKRLSFAGHVVVPEWADGEYYDDAVDQFEWDVTGLDKVSIILFWVPRKLTTMPGLTTNVEFGRYLSLTPQRVLYGRPDEADSIQYLDWLYEKQTNRPVINHLETLLVAAVNMVANNMVANDSS